LADGLAGKFARQLVSFAPPAERQGESYKQGEKMMPESDKSGELILAAVLLAAGFFIVRKIIKASGRSGVFFGSTPPILPELSQPQTVPTKVISRVSSRSNRKIIKVKKVVEVKASPLPYHLQQGWEKIGRAYRGYYRCKFGSFKGEILEKFNGEFIFYIFDPPPKVLGGPHGACFTSSGVNNKYHVHFGLNAGSLDGGIMAVERVLYQGFNRR